MNMQFIPVSLLTKLITFFIIVTFCFIVADNARVRCEPKSKVNYVLSKIVSYSHSTYFVYFFLGSLMFGYHFIHFYICFINIVTWAYFNKIYGIGCPATYIENNLCPPDDMYYQYQDVVHIILARMFKAKKFSEILPYYYGVCLVVFFYDAYYILR